MTLSNYVSGDELLILKVVDDNDDNYALIEVSSESEAVVDITYTLEGEHRIDGVSEYGYGLWTKFMM